MEETNSRLSLEEEVCDALTDFFNDLSDVITNPQISNLEEQIEDCLDTYTAQITALVSKPAQPEIVRCRDCKHVSVDEFGGGWCGENCREVKPWDFCAWGERDDGQTE